MTESTNNAAKSSLLSSKALNKAQDQLGKIEISEKTEQIATKIWATGILFLMSLEVDASNIHETKALDTIFDAIKLLDNDIAKPSSSSLLTSFQVYTFANALNEISLKVAFTLYPDEEDILKREVTTELIYEDLDASKAERAQWLSECLQ